MALMDSITGSDRAENPKRAWAQGGMRLARRGVTRMTCVGGFDMPRECIVNAGEKVEDFAQFLLTYA